MNDFTFNIFMLKDLAASFNNNLESHGPGVADYFAESHIISATGNVTFRTSHMVKV